MGNKYNDSSIVSLDGLQHIRFRSGAYGFHPNDPSGIQLLVTEILHNSIDEAKLDLRKAQQIDIVFHKLKDTFQCVVLDTGRGVPLKRIKPVFTQPNTSGKWKDEYVGSAGAHGVGVKSSPALSRYFIACSKRPEGYANVCTVDAKITNTGLVSIPKRKQSSASGTIVAVEPDPSVMPNVKGFFDKKGPYANIVDYIQFVAASLTNTSFRVLESHHKLDLKSLVKETPEDTWDILSAYINNSEVIIAPNKEQTVSSYLLGEELSDVEWDSGELNMRGVKVPVTIQSGLTKKTHASMNLNVQLLYTGKSSIMGSVNMVRINDKTSSHLKSLITATKLKLVDMVDPKMQEFFTYSYQLPLHLIALTEYQHAVFVNQDKSRFIDHDFEAGFLQAIDTLFSTIDEKCWDELHGLLQEDIKIKWSKKQRRGLRMTTDSKNLAFTLNNPRCFFECKDTGVGTELLICEGVSSGDWVKVNRDTKTQAVFELTGKVLNSFRNKNTTIEDLAKNKVIGDLIRVLGTSPEDDELTTCRYEKIGILTDSDSDGSHIASLVLAALWHINPALITHNRVMLLNPPLYVVTLKGNDNKFYVKNENGLIKFKAGYYARIMGMSLDRYDSDKVELLVDDEVFSSLYLLIQEVTSVIVQVSIEHHIDPNLCEMLTACVDLLIAGDLEELGKRLGCDSCTMSTNQDTLYLLAQGYETIVPLHGLIESINEVILPLIRKYHFDKFTILISDANFDNAPMTLMELRELFLRYDQLFEVKRLKGLGELDAEGLLTTCLDKETRVVTTITGIGDLTKIKSLMGVDSAARKELVTSYVK